MKSSVVKIAKGIDLMISNFDEWYNGSNQRQRCCESILDIIREHKLDKEMETDMLT